MVLPSIFLLINGFNSIFAMGYSPTCSAGRTYAEQLYKLAYLALGRTVGTRLVKLFKRKLASTEELRRRSRKEC